MRRPPAFVLVAALAFVACPGRVQGDGAEGEGEGASEGEGEGEDVGGEGEGEGAAEGEGEGEGEGAAEGEGEGEGEGAAEGEGEGEGAGDHGWVQIFDAFSITGPVDLAGDIAIAIEDLVGQRCVVERIRPDGSTAFSTTIAVTSSDVLCTVAAVGDGVVVATSTEVGPTVVTAGAFTKSLAPHEVTFVVMDADGNVVNATDALEGGVKTAVTATTTGFASAIMTATGSPNEVIRLRRHALDGTLLRETTLPFGVAGIQARTLAATPDDGVVFAMDIRNRNDVVLPAASGGDFLIPARTVEDGLILGFDASDDVSFGYALSGDAAGDPRYFLSATTAGDRIVACGTAGAFAVVDLATGASVQSLGALSAESAVLVELSATTGFVGATALSASRARQFDMCAFAADGAVLATSEEIDPPGSFAIASLGTETTSHDVITGTRAVGQDLVVTDDAIYVAASELSSDADTSVFVDSGGIVGGDANEQRAVLMRIDRTRRGF